MRRWTDFPPICLAHAWRRGLAVGLAFSLGFLIWLSASPERHHDLHAECGEHSETCVVTQWLTGGAIETGVPEFVVVFWIRCGGVGREVFSHLTFPVGAWMWAQGPPVRV